MESYPQPQLGPVSMLADDREQFLQELVAELRGHRVLSDQSLKALIHHVDDLTHSQLIALLQALGAWPSPLPPPGPDARHVASSRT